MMNEREDIGALLFSEPRIPAIRGLLEALLRVVELETDGRPVKIDGFRLRRPADWVLQHQTPLSPNMLLDGLASACNVSCRFCYIKGNPPTWNPEPNSPGYVLERLRERLRWYNEDRGETLFLAATQYYEPFANPRIVECLELIREKCQGPICLTTNGHGLTPDVVAQLARLKPVYVTLSLNSSDPCTRMDLMRDSKPEVAIHSVDYLRDFNVPFAVSCVPWPTVPFERVSECLFFADAAGAERLGVSLPGYTGLSGADAEWFDTQVYWTELVEKLMPLRRKLKSPLLITPYLFEETLLDEHLRHKARVVGIGRHSPALAAGFQIDDILLTVDGHTVTSRPHARDLCLKAERLGTDPVRFTIMRDGRELNLKMSGIYDRTGHGSHCLEKPRPTADGALGLFIPSGFRRQALTLLKRSLRDSHAKSAAVIISRLMKPALEQALRESDFYVNLDSHVHFIVAENAFLGGNILIGDLLVDQDIIKCLEEFIAHHGRPDICFVPSSMFTPGFGWKRDLNGAHFREIEHATGVRVELLQCEQVLW